MLSSNWQVTLRLTVFETLRLNGQNSARNLGLGVPLGIPPPKAELSVRDRYVSQNFMPISEIPVTGQRKYSSQYSLPIHTDVFSILMYLAGSEKTTCQSAVDRYWPLRQWTRSETDQWSSLEYRQPLDRTVVVHCALILHWKSLQIQNNEHIIRYKYYSHDRAVHRAQRTSAELTTVQCHLLCHCH